MLDLAGTCMIQFFGATAPLRQAVSSPHGPQKNVNITLDKPGVLWHGLAHGNPRICEILPKKMLDFWGTI